MLEVKQQSQDFTALQYYYTELKEPLTNIIRWDDQRINEEH